MSLPKPPQKYDQPGILTARQMAAYRQTSRPSPPQTAVLCYQTPLLRHAVKKYKGQAVAGFPGEFFRLKKLGHQIGVAGRFGIGAPMTAVLLEDLAAWGVRQFLILGIAGSIAPAIQPDEFVVVDKALRDEGTSYHYLPPKRFVAAAPNLVVRIQQGLKQAKLPYTTGATWTTDAPYRETAVEVQQYGEEGVLTVDMEAAALFAAAQFCQVEAAAVFCLSDSLADGRWQPASSRESVHQRLITLFDTLIPPLYG